DGGRLRPRLEPCRGARAESSPGSAGHRDPGSRRGPGRPRALSVTSLVRDGMLSDPAALPSSASAQEAAEHLVRPDVRVVLVVDDEGTLVGVVTPDALVERVVAEGLDPATTPVSSIAAPPLL